MTYNHTFNRNQSVMYFTFAVAFPLLALCAIPMALGFVSSESCFGLNLPAAFRSAEGGFALHAFITRAAVGCAGLLFLLHLLVGRKVRECCYVYYLIFMVSGLVLLPMGMTFLFIYTR